MIVENEAMFFPNTDRQLPGKIPQNEALGLGRGRRVGPQETSGSAFKTPGTHGVHRLTPECSGACAVLGKAGVFILGGSGSPCSPASMLAPCVCHRLSLESQCMFPRSELC